MPTRRDLLQGSGAVLAGGTLAGCTSPPSDADDGVFASFFTLAEFTRAVVGDAHEVENAVPMGGHGHGWTPSVDMLPSIVESEAFVYLDVDGFQPWAEDVAGKVRNGYADDVVLVDALAGIELLEYEGHDHSHDEHQAGDSEHDEIGRIDTFELVDRSVDDAVGEAHGDHWHGGPPDVPLDEHVSLGAVVTDENGTDVPLGDDSQYTLDASVGEGDGALDVESHGDHVHLHGDSNGTVEVVFQLREDGERRWEAPPTEVDVVETIADDTDDDDQSHSHDDDHDHSHGEYDAKFFTDPVRAQQGVRNIRDALVEIDPENADSYEANTAAYIDELEELHEQYETTLAAREHDVAVVAGHDSFQYLGDRYGFEIHTPVGLSPDHEPAPDEIAETVELVESEGIDCILWDYFDGDDIATVIADEVDHEVTIEMVSPAESVTEEWNEDGVGSYINQMKEINLPAFAKALGAE